MFRIRLAFACLAIVVACSQQRPASDASARGDRSAALTGEAAGPAVRAGIITVAPVTRASSPQSFTELGGVALFSAADAWRGAELWRTDGTEAGTALVADINRGSLGSAPSGFTVIDGIAYFAADDGVHGVELWRTDGTADGTALVADIFPGPSGSSPTDLVAHGATLFFAASDPLHGTELWRSDGTPSGTWMVADLAPGGMSSSPYCLTSTPQGVFLGAADPASTWRSDGTATGTMAVDAFAPALGGEACFHAIGEAVYFLGGANLSLSRVDPGGVAMTVGAATQGRGLVQAGGFLYWAGDPAGATVKGAPLDLLSYDGVAEVALTSGGVEPRALRSDGARVVFTASTAESGREPWVAEGLSARILADDCAGSCSSMAEGTYVAAAGGQFFLTSGTVGGAYTLCRTDGIAPPTAIAATPYVLSGSGALSGVLLFAGSGGEPWCSDGTPEGTRQVANVAFDGSLPGLSQLTPVAGGVTLQASDGSVWFTDGDGVDRVGGFTSPLIVGAVGDSLIVAAYTGTSAYTPYVSVAGAPAVRWTAVSSIAREKGATLDGVLYFAGTDATYGTELWRTDGTTAGTWRVADLLPGSGSSTPRGFTVSGNRVYFSATDGIHGGEPWVTDGTPAGTHLVKDVFVGGNSAMNAIAPDGRGGLYFSAMRWAFDKGLWHTDGTEAGTQRISDVDPGTGQGPGYGLLVGGVVYMRAKDALGAGIWRSDGTPEGTWLVARGDSPVLAALDGFVYFSMNDPVVGRELWRTDGSPGTAELVRDLLPGLANGVSTASPLAIEEAGVILLAGDNGIAGTELWATDGTAPGTRLVQDLAPGAFQSNPSEFTRAGTASSSMPRTSSWAASRGASVSRRSIGGHPPSPARRTYSPRRRAGGAAATSRRQSRRTL
jgi:ELWxxDGT repeat protein